MLKRMKQQATQGSADVGFLLLKYFMCGLADERLSYFFSYVCCFNQLMGKKSFIQIKCLLYVYEKP